MLETIRLRSQPAVVAARVGLDQFVLTPPLLGVFFTTMSLMEGKGVEGAKDRISSQWWPTLQRNWALFCSFRTDIGGDFLLTTLMLAQCLYKSSILPSFQLTCVL